MAKLNQTKTKQKTLLLSHLTNRHPCIGQEELVSWRDAFFLQPFQQLFHCIHTRQHRFRLVVFSYQLTIIHQILVRLFKRQERITKKINNTGAHKT